MDIGARISARKPGEGDGSCTDSNQTCLERTRAYTEAVRAGDGRVDNMGSSVKKEEVGYSSCD